VRQIVIEIYKFGNFNLKSKNLVAKKNLVVKITNFMIPFVSSVRFCQVERF